MKMSIAKGNLNFRFTGKTNRCDNFYEYLSGEMSLPDILVIGNDCKNKHGINGKTVRRATKDKSAGICLRCEQKKSSLRKEAKNKSREQNTKTHKRAMDLYDEQQHKDNGFLI